MQIRVYSGAMPTTGRITPIALAGTTMKSILQVKPSATLPLKVKAYGISFDGFVAAQPGSVELVEVDVAATVTAFVNSDLHRKDAEAIAAGDLTTNLIQVGTSASGFDASAEGSITAARVFGSDLVAPTNQFVYQFPLGDEPFIQVAKFLRLRCYFPGAVNVVGWVDLTL
jgi:hypothetical protein